MLLLGAPLKDLGALSRTKLLLTALFLCLLPGYSSRVPTVYLHQGEGWTTTPNRTIQIVTMEKDILVFFSSQ